jgi:hypothetical protein
MKEQYTTLRNNMSVKDEGAFDNGEQIVGEDTPKKPAGRKPRVEQQQTVRKHKVENVNKNRLADVLDAYHAEGRTVIALNISRDIGGTYEVVSYKNEPVH